MRQAPESAIVGNAVEVLDSSLESQRVLKQKIVRRNSLTVAQFHGDEWDWDSALLKQERETADVVNQYPGDFCGFCLPFLFDRAGDVVRTLVAVFVFEGIIGGILEKTLDTGVGAQHWLLDTIDGKHPFYKQPSCWPTMFDNLCLQVLVLTLTIIALFISERVMGRRKAEAIVSSKGVTFKRARRDAGVLQIMNESGVVSEPTVRCRALAGPTYHNATAFWVGGHRVYEVEERLEVADVAVGLREARETYTPFPQWHAVYCGTQDGRMKAAALVQAQPHDFEKSQGVCCGEVENQYCMSPCRASLPVMNTMFIDNVALTMNDFGVTKIEYSSTWFSWWRMVYLIALVILFLSLLTPLLKPNYAPNSWLFGKARKGCGHTFIDVISGTFIIMLIVVLVVAIRKRGKYKCDVLLTSAGIFCHSARRSCKIRWEDIEAVHSIPCCLKPFECFCCLCGCRQLRTTDLVLEVKQCALAELSDGCRSTCSLCCCAFGYFDCGVCGLCYFNAEHTMSKMEWAYVQVPGLAKYIDDCSGFSHKFKEVTELQDFHAFHKLNYTAKTEATEAARGSTDAFPEDVGTQGVGQASGSDRFVEKNDYQLGASRSARRDSNSCCMTCSSIFV